MREKSGLKIIVVLAVGIIFMVGLAIYTEEIKCAYPGCNNRRVTDTGICLECRKKIGIVTPDGSGSSDNSSYKSNANSAGKSNAGQSTVSNYSKPKSTGNTKKYKTYGVEDYDNPDDYASDYAEDFAYDEFGDDDSAYSYDYGYEEAYEYWMDEMGE